MLLTLRSSICRFKSSKKIRTRHSIREGTFSSHLLLIFFRVHYIFAPYNFFELIYINMLNLISYRLKGPEATTASFPIARYFKPKGSGLVALIECMVLPDIPARPYFLLSPLSGFICPVFIFWGNGQGA